ncbi:hypothetical protein D3C72_1604220 [compost metagenome]
MAHDGHQPLGAERLFDEVVGALAHGLHRHRDVAVAGDQDHGQLGIGPMQLAQPFGAAQARQAHVADDDGRHAEADVCARALGAVKGFDLETGQGQHLGRAEADVFVVLDQHHPDGGGFAHLWITPVEVGIRVFCTAAGRSTTNEAPPAG